MRTRIGLSPIGGLLLGAAMLVACGQSEPLRRGDDGRAGATGGAAQADRDASVDGATGAGAEGGSTPGAGGATSTGTGSGPSGSGGSLGGSGGAGARPGNDTGGGPAAGGSGGNGGASSGGTAGTSGSAGYGGGAGHGAAGAGGTSGSNGGSSGGGAAGGQGTGGATGDGGGAGGTAGHGGAGGSGGTLPDAGGPGETVHFAVYGDTRTGSAMHQNVIDQIAKLNPELVIHSGDLWDGYSQATFTSILKKNANIASLLDSGRYVVSRGNHESVTDFMAFRPSLTRGNASELFSYTIGNSFFVVLGMDPGKAAAFLEAELKKPEALAARWRFVQSHYSIYSGGTTHGARGNPTIEKLCDTYHVTVYWSGHDHIYERSHQVYGGQIVDNDDELSASSGTVYVVSGGGGAPLYGVSPIATTHLQASANNYVDVLAAADTLTVKAYKVDGSVVDSFVISQ